MNGFRVISLAPNAIAAISLPSPGPLYWISIVPWALRRLKIPPAYANLLRLHYRRGEFVPGKDRWEDPGASYLMGIDGRRPSAGEATVKLLPAHARKSVGCVSGLP